MLNIHFIMTTIISSVIPCEEKPKLVARWCASLSSSG